MTGQAMTKSQKAYQSIRRMIISHRFLPEHRWSMRKLAVRLRMSVVPISEAVRRLEQEGILEVSPQRGISLVQLTTARQQELRVVREGLEVQAARLLAGRVDERTLERLEAAAARLQHLLGEGKLERAALVDYDLHRQLVKATGSSMLAERFDQVATLAMLAIDTLDSRWVDQEFSGEVSHQALVEAIAGGDPEAADRAVREHVGSLASVGAAPAPEGA